jgi:hypothetical protein
MSSISHSPAERERTLSANVRNMWAAIAICVMWLVVMIDALWGPDFVSTSGSSATRIPSAILLGLFAWFGTKAVAKYGFEHDD